MIIEASDEEILGVHGSINSESSDRGVVVVEVGLCWYYYKIKEF